MAEAAVEPSRNPPRFFCHRCNVEFEDVIQSDTCPYCATGFIERLESDEDRDLLLRNFDDGEYSDADMSNLDDAGNTDDSILEDSLNGSNINEVPPMLNDLAFLMSGRRTRSSGTRPPRQETLMQHLVWMIGAGLPGTGAVTAGAPFVLVGAPGDYVFGGEGLDAVVTQLLGQLENSGPPPLPAEQIDAIPSEEITAAQVEASMSCSVCWDNFTQGESVSRLECEHIFHPACISPWLQLHATCPICRRSLLPPAPAPAAPAAPAPAPAPAPPPAPAASDLSQTTSATDISSSSTPSISPVVVRRISARRRRGPGTDSSSGSGTGGSVGGLWAHLTSSISSLANESASSLNSDRYMDIDYD